MLAFGSSLALHHSNPVLNKSEAVHNRASADLDVSRHGGGGGQRWTVKPSKEFCLPASDALTIMS